MLLATRNEPLVRALRKEGQPGDQSHIVNALDKCVSRSRMDYVLKHSILVNESVKEGLRVLVLSHRHSRIVDAQQSRPKGIVLIRIVNRRVGSVLKDEAMQDDAIEVIFTHDDPLLADAEGRSIGRARELQRFKFSARKLEPIIPERCHEPA